MKVIARFVVVVEVDVNDAKTQEEASERVRASEIALLGWEDHQHNVTIEDVEIT